MSGRARCTRYLIAFGQRELTADHENHEERDHRDGRRIIVDHCRDQAARATARVFRPCRLMSSSPFVDHCVALICSELGEAEVHGSQTWLRPDHRDDQADADRGPAYEHGGDRSARPGLGLRIEALAEVPANFGCS